MKRLQIYIDEDLDERLGAIAIREKTSKAALIRKYVAERLSSGAKSDPIDALVGSIHVEPASVDDVVYR